MSIKNGKKILITQDYNPLKGTGISVVTFGTALNLAKLDFDVTFATYDLPDNLDGCVQDKVKVVKLNKIDDLCKLVNDTDIVIPAVSFSYIFKAFGVAVAKICEKYNKPFIPWVHTTIQNSKFNNIYGVNDFVQKSSIFLLSEMFKSNQCKSIIAVSDAVKCSISSLGVSDEKIFVLLNGLDLNLMGSKLLDAPNKTNDVICVQRFSPEKGNQLTIAVLALLKKLSPNFSAIIIGGGEEIGAVLSLIKIFGLENNIKIIPKMVNGELIGAIQNSKVFLSTSFTESFGLAIAESMFVGTPVVVPNIEGPAELVEGGKCGFTFDSGDTLTPATILNGIIKGNTDTSKIIAAAKSKIANDCDIVKQTQKMAGVIRNSL